MGRHMVALWCQPCTYGRFWSTWSVCALPPAVLVRIYGFLDVVSGACCQRGNWKCLRTPLAEGSVMPMPRFMSINDVARPSPSHNITLVNRSLHDFAVNSAGIRSMINAVFTRIKLSREVMEPWRGPNLVACRRATRLVVGLEITLADVEDDSDLELTVAAVQSRLRRRQAYSTPDVRPENPGPPRHFARRPSLVVRERPSSSRAGGAVDEPPEPVVPHLGITFMRCAHPDCVFRVHEDATVSEVFCCQRCGEMSAANMAPEHGRKCQERLVPAPPKQPPPTDVVDLTSESSGSGGRCGHPACGFRTHEDETVSKDFCCKRCGEMDDCGLAPEHGRLCQRRLHPSTLVLSGIAGTGTRLHPGSCVDPHSGPGPSTPRPTSAPVAGLRPEVWQGIDGGRDGADDDGDRLAKAQLKKRKALEMQGGVEG